MLLALALVQLHAPLSTVYNVDAFDWVHSGADPTDLECAERALPHSRLRFLYPFTGAESGTTIADGGNDMYDGGNEIRVQVNGVWSEPLEYTQVCHGGAGREAHSPSGHLGDAEYNTCMLPTGTPYFIAAVYSRTGSITGFRVNGNLGADGGGSRAASSLPLETTATVPAGGPEASPPPPDAAGAVPPSPSPPPPGPGYQVYGFYKAVYSAQSDPSVNHLVIAPSPGTSTVGLTTDSDLQQVELEYGVNVLYYVLWGGARGHQYVEGDFQNVLESISQACFSLRHGVEFKSPPPPLPPDMAGCDMPCGLGTCLDFQYVAASELPPGCTGCPTNCNGKVAPPPVPSAPPPRLASPAPAPLACHNPCGGGTCGNFVSATTPTSCTELIHKGCDCTGCCASPTDLRCVTSEWPTVGLPHLFAFTEGMTGRGISDGGSDMFDGANYLAVILGNKYQRFLEYTQDCNGLFPTPLQNGDGSDLYATCKLTDGQPIANNFNNYNANNGDVSTGTLFAASFYSPQSHINGFLTYGNLGADGGGAFESMNLTGAPGSHGVYGYYKQVYGAGSDPSINHLIITRAPPGDLNFHALDISTNSDYQSVHFKTGQQMLIYLLWAGKMSDEGSYESYRYERHHAQRVLDTIGSSCFSFLPPSTHPEPSPPPSYDLTKPACSYACGTNCPGDNCKTTCADFAGTSCSLLRSGDLPFTCDCGECCDSGEHESPAASPPAPPAPPLPMSPVDGACHRACAGSTCGAYQPMKCQDMGLILGCDCSGCCESELDARCIERQWPGNLPGLYSFSDGILGYSIRDGGGDMYDVGNEVRVRVSGQWSGPLDYTQNCDGSRPRSINALRGGWGENVVNDVSYITCKLPVDFPETLDRAFGRAFVFIAHSKTGAIDGLSIMGNLGADEGGAQVANGCSGHDCKGPMLSGAKGVVGYYKKTYGANAPGVALADPSVNHLIFGRNIEDAHVTIGSTTDSDLHELKFAHGTDLVYYVMFAGTEGYEYPLADFQDVLNRLSASCYDGDYLPERAEAGGVSFGTIVLILIGIVAVVVVGGAVFFVAKSGALSGLFKMRGGRARTGAAGSSTVNIGNPPLQTPRMGLAGADSAAEYATSYAPPPPSSSM